MKEIFVNLLRQTPTILIMGMRIEVCYHPCLRVSGVTLNGFDVTAADLKFQRSAAVTQTMKHHWTQKLRVMLVTPFHGGRIADYLLAVYTMTAPCAAGKDSLHDTYAVFSFEGAKFFLDCGMVSGLLLRLFGKSYIIQDEIVSPV